MQVLHDSEAEPPYIKYKDAQSVEGADNIRKELKRLNDIKRTTENVDTTDEQSLHMHARFAALAGRPSSIPLELIDTPGPNEHGLDLRSAVRLA